VVLVAPVLISPPVARPSQPARQPSDAATFQAGGVQIYTAQQLSDMIGNPSWIGRSCSRRRADRADEIPTLSL